MMLPLPPRVLKSCVHGAKDVMSLSKKTAVKAESFAEPPNLILFPIHPRQRKKAAGVSYTLKKVGE